MLTVYYARKGREEPSGSKQFQARWFGVLGSILSCMKQERTKEREGKQER